MRNTEDMFALCSLFVGIIYALIAFIRPFSGKVNINSRKSSKQQEKFDNLVDRGKIMPHIFEKTTTDKVEDDK